MVDLISNLRPSITYKPVDADDWIGRQPEDVGGAGAARAAALIEAAALREIRTALKRARAEIAGVTGTSQDRVSKLERGDDALVSTLRRHVRALGNAGGVASCNLCGAPMKKL